MAHEIAKILLEQSGSKWERERAIEMAMGLGMPLNEVEAYLDWIDLIRTMDRKSPPAESGQQPPGPEQQPRGA